MSSFAASKQARRPMHRRVTAIGLSFLLAFGVVANVASTATAVAPVGQGFNLEPSDLRFIMRQIRISQAHSAGGDLFGPGPLQVNERRLPFGLRTVDGTYNHLSPNQITFGAADEVFPRMTTPVFREAEPSPFGPPGPATSYTQKKGTVFDSQPRVISNAIVDQTSENPAAVSVAGPDCDDGPLVTCPIPNAAPDVGLSAPFNPVFTFFGQFFDHGLDLVTKGGSGTVFMPLQEDDPLFDADGPDNIPNNGDETNFMLLTRATNLPGPDGILGDPDPAAPDTSIDDIQEGTNTTTPFVDQNQTYTSHPSHQVFLREYDSSSGVPLPTGSLIDGFAGNIGNWAEVKAQAADLLGIQLVDKDVFNIPLLATDPYGHFMPGPNGFPQLVFPGNVLVEGDPTANGGLGVLADGSVKTGHAFLDDIAHNAVPSGTRTPDADTDISTVPGSQPAGTYDDELLNAHFITGDGRGNENIALTAVHTVFHSEHNRLSDEIDALIHDPGFGLSAAEVAEWETTDPASGWTYGERLFQAARFVTEMEYQHLVFEEFARKMVPNINPFIGDGVSFLSDVDPSISAEFAHAVFRLGHSMLTEQVTRTNEDGSDNSIPLLEAFLNPVEFNDGGTAGPLNAAAAAGSIIQGMSRDVANELDEFVTDDVRNRLLGLPLDLAAINIARGRSEGLPPLNEVRRQLFDSTGHPELAPYESWVDFSFNLKHEESLVNFVAAYGTHPEIMSATGIAAKREAADQILYGTVLPGPDGLFGTDCETATPSPECADNDNPPTDREDFNYSTGFYATNSTGLDEVDLWMGGLAEKQAPFGSLLGSTFNYVFEITLENLQNADRFYYLERLNGLNLLAQLEGNSFSELIMRNTTVEGVPADIFSRPDLVFNLRAQNASGAIVDDPGTTEYDERTLLVRMPNGTIRFNGGEHVVWNGRDVGTTPSDVDRVFSSEGDDTFRGNSGNDTMEGGSGNDQFIGGLGDDILTDIFGTDVLKGGDGNDVLSSGPGPDDLNQGGRGNDYILSGSDVTETLAGPGNDIVYAGEGENAALGDSGNDWIQGGPMLDLLIGDGDNQFQDDADGGHDVIMGGLGDDDYDSEGGDDVMINDSLGTERNEGMLGFDWSTYRGDSLPVDADMDIGGLLPPNIDELRDRFDLTEALSGWNFDDILRGDSRIADDMVGHELTAAGPPIEGLTAFLNGATTFTGGNILMGGAGNDLIEGRGGNDLIDGDAWFNAQLEAPNLATPVLTDTKRVDSMMALRTDVLAGRINPGAISIVRSIVTTGADPLDVDTAVFTDPLANYEITDNGDGTTTVAHVVVGAVDDGTDTLRNMELLQFADGTIAVNSPATGTVTINDTTPTEGQLLTATQAITDSDGINLGTLLFVWEAEVAPDVWVSVGAGSTFTVGDAEAGQRLRVTASFQDGNGTFESITSAPTAAVININDAPVGTAALSSTTPRQGTPLTASTVPIVDADGLTGTTFNFQWQQRVGLTFQNIAGATNSTFTPGAAQIGRVLRVVVSFTDNQGTLETVTSATTGMVTNPPPAATVPGAPGIRSAQQGNNGGAITVVARWNAPASNGGRPITGYRVTAIRESNGATTTITVGNVLTANVPGLVNGALYRTQVRAINSIGVGAPSAISTAARAR